jgi:hypothetical protein
MVPVSVTDSQGQAIQGLQVSDFRLEEEGKQQEIARSEIQSRFLSTSQSYSTSRVALVKKVFSSSSRTPPPPSCGW